MSRNKAVKAQAIKHLLAGEPVSSVAQLVGVTPKTVYRWLETPEFVAALHSQEKQVLDACSFRLVGLAHQAIDALQAVLEHPGFQGSNTKRLAAVAVLELVLKWRELVSFEERLSNLERQVQDGKK